MLKLESEGAMFFLGKYVYSQIPEKWQKIVVTHAWVFTPGTNKEVRICEIFAARVLQIHFAIKKTDPGDKLCRAALPCRRSEFFFKLLWGDYLAHNIHSQKATQSLGGVTLWGHFSIPMAACALS